MKDIDGMTTDRILKATLELMKDKSFRVVTIRDIAQASSVSEMTVFRHFRTKRGVLEAAISKYSFVPFFKEIFEKQIVHDLENDLYLIATTYLNQMQNNKSIFLIAIQERSTMPELTSIISNNTGQFRDLLTDYFATMQSKNKMMKVDANALTITFMATLFGYFSSIAFWGELFIRETSEEFVKTMVAMFCNGLKKEAEMYE